MATEEELSPIRENLFGQIDEQRIVRVDIPRPGREIVARFTALTDLCSTVADALDELGTGHTVSGSVIVPRAPGARLVGPTVTLRYVREGGTAGSHIAGGDRAGLADRDLYGVASPGDVAVFDCAEASDASVMGGLSANWARRRELAGCVIDGAMRDVESVVALGLPVWSRAVTPRTGKHRMRAAEINGPVTLAGCPVIPGDLIVADGAGLCIVPADDIQAVLAICEQAEATERQVLQAMATASSPAQLTAIYPAARW